MKFSNSVLMLSVSAAVVAGCATKRYPVATPLSPTQAGLMNCRELALELSEIDQVQLQITQTAETDWRSVAGFLGDYGIGNAMARSEAETALAERRASIQSAMIQKECPGYGVPEADDE